MAGWLPAALGQVHPRTSTPIAATAIIVGAVLFLALIFPLEKLARTTSWVMLVIYILVNAALIAVKSQKDAADAAGAKQPAFSVPIWVPILGILVSAGFLFSGLFTSPKSQPSPMKPKV